MKAQLTSAIVCCSALLTSNASAQEAVLLTSEYAVEVWSTLRETSIEGLMSATITLRSPEDTRLVTLTELELTGGVHQVWRDSPAAGGPTQTVDHFDQPSWAGIDGRPFDSHMLITADMVGGGAGESFGGISETNDASSNFASQIGSEDMGVMTGFGDLALARRSDFFFLREEFQSNELDVLHVAGCGEANLSFSVLGSGLIFPDRGDTFTPPPPMFDSVDVFAGMAPACVPEPRGWLTLLFAALAVLFSSRGSLPSIKERSP